MWLPIPGRPEDSIYDSTARFNIWDGPVRSGKTVHSLLRWIEFAMVAPKGDVWMIGRTSGSLERNILAPLKDFTGGVFDYSLTQNKAWLADREIYIIGASNKDAEGRIRGSTAAAGYGDEITLWPSEVFRQFGLRMSVRGAKFFGTTNPDGPYHWLKTDYLDKEGLNLRRFNWEISENTTLDPEYIKALEAEYTGLWYKRFIKGLWVAAEGAIYDFWDEDLHTILSPPAADYHYGAVDYGTSNATAAGVFGARKSDVKILGADGKPIPRVWLAGEYYHSGRDTGRQKTDAEYASDLQEFYRPFNITHLYVDPSAASFKAELRKRGFNLRDANNDVVNGIRFQARMLAGGEYRVGAGCKQTIKDYSAYLWDPRAQARGLDAPLKQNDHTKDFERYGLYSEFGQVIAQQQVTRRPVHQSY